MKEQTGYLEFIDELAGNVADRCGTFMYGFKDDLVDSLLATNMIKIVNVYSGTAFVKKNYFYIYRVFQ